MKLIEDGARAMASLNQPFFFIQAFPFCEPIIDNAVSDFLSLKRPSAISTVVVSAAEI